MNNGTQTQIQFPSAFNRRPLFAIFAFQHQSMFGQQYANPHSYVNIFPTQTYAQTGQGQLFPSQPIISDYSTADQTNLYQELMTIANIRPDIAGFTYNINYDDFRTTYPFICINFRDADMSQLPTDALTNLTLFTDMNLFTVDNANQYQGDLIAASQNGTVPYRTLINGIPQPDFPNPTTPLFCYCFLVVERIAEITFTPNNMLIKMNFHLIN